MSNKIIFAILAVLFVIVIGIFAFSQHADSSMDENARIVDANALTEKGVLKLDSKKQDENNGLFISATGDENSVFVNNSSILKLTNSIINKTGDTKSTGDDADFYGVNSAVLVKDLSQLTIENCEINTNSKGSNGIFVTNTDSGSSLGGTPGEGGKNAPEQPELQKDNQKNNQTTANIKNVKITTHQDKSRGLDATFGGVINAENIIIDTDGNSCAALATDRGEGNVTVTNSILNTGANNGSGRGSPLMYSTGNITVKDSSGTSYVSQIACIEGKNSIDIQNSHFIGFGEGNRKDGDNYVDLGGIFIYQSMSGDADVGTSTFNCKNSELTIDPSSGVYKKAPMFHITNTKANINLETSTFNFGSGVLFDISGQNQWGTVGSNGGEVNLTTNNEDLKGNVIVDAISSLSWNLKSTSFEGAINSTGSTNIVIEEGSEWTLTGDSNITSLDNQGKINLNGHKLLVNGVEYKG